MKRHRTRGSRSTLSSSSSSSSCYCCWSIGMATLLAMVSASSSSSILLSWMTIVLPNIRNARVAAWTMRNPSMIRTASRGLATRVVPNSGRLFHNNYPHNKIQSSLSSYSCSPWLPISAAFSTSSSTRLFSSLDEEDSQGRIIRRRQGWDDDDDNGDTDDWGGNGASKNDRSRRNVDSSRGRDNVASDDWDPNYTPKNRSRQPQRQGNNSYSNRSNNNNRGSYSSSWSENGRGGGGGGAARGGRGQFDRFPQRNTRNARSSARDNNNNKGRAINMNALEAAGFVHLYGLSSVLKAFEADRRDLTTVQERTNVEDPWANEEMNDDHEGQQQEEVKPPAQFRPYLFVQERASGTSRRAGQKASDAERVMELAQERNVPIAHVDKGILNTLSGNRPHQGFVLRCGKLYFESLSRVPRPDQNVGEDVPSIWLVLDEVVDPQNLGALLRSAYFLGQRRIGVLVCSKNSAPPTPVVSAASAGALEILTVYSTNNLPRTLNQARDDGFRIIGASSSVPNTSSEYDDETPPPLYDLQNLPVPSEEDDSPVLLVLGSEGHGLRTLVAKACTEFVRIPSGAEQEEGNDSNGGGVDSLNVSVTGGILLWHLLRG